MSTVRYIAVCTGCSPSDPEPIPFTEIGKRDVWVRTHKRKTGHRVEVGLYVVDDEMELLVSDSDNIGYNRPGTRT